MAPIESGSGRLLGARKPHSSETPGDGQEATNIPTHELFNMCILCVWSYRNRIDTSKIERLDLSRDSSQILDAVRLGSVIRAARNLRYLKTASMD